VTRTIAAIAEAGDSALVAAFEERVDPAVNDLAVKLARRLHAARLDGIRDIVPAFHTVTVYFDPLVADRRELRAQLTVPLMSDAAVKPGAHHEILVRYEGEDLGEVARITGLSEQQIVEAHTAGTYRVFMLGFLPGFAYMGTLDPRIAVPRRTAPRTRVPAGAVAIAGQQTGIYPMESPGGWHLIGRTNVRPYDPDRDRPFMFSAGDTVRFAAE
jgi:inhibitor of KinA